MRYVLALGAVMALVLMAMLHAGYRYLVSTRPPAIVVGSWEPDEPVWPWPTLQVKLDFPLPFVQTAEGWGFTPNAYFLPERMAPELPPLPPPLVAMGDPDSQR